MEPFTQLGTLVESRWRDQNYNEKLFPEIAAQALAEMKLSERVDPWEIIHWVQTTPNLPEQMDLEADFGDPPLTLYVGPRFYIDVYFWLDGTTSIHQHAFSGAFQVLLGSSVHTRYSFQKEQEINAHFVTGKILLQDISLLARNDIREINPGSEFIHSLFHLERPSATITVRNYKTSGEAVQFSYVRPFLAYHPFFTDASLKRKLQTVELLLKMKHPETDRFLGELIDSSDFQTAYSVLKRAFQFLCHRDLEDIFGVSRSADRFQALLDRARGRHGELADLLPPVFEEEWRQDDITRRRATIKDEDHRFFLALLLNVPDRATLLKFVKQKFPDQEPIELVLSWIRQLAATRIFGTREPNVLGLKDFDDRFLFVCKGLLEDLSVDEIKARAATEPSFAAKSDLQVENLATQIKELPLFKSIFASP